LIFICNIGLTAEEVLIAACWLHCVDERILCEGLFHVLSLFTKRGCWNVKPESVQDGDGVQRFMQLLRRTA